jgi:hypothetical protein
VTYWAAEIVFLFLRPISAENGRTHPLRKEKITPWNGRTCFKN